MSELLSAADEAAKNAYAPYSSFFVGAVARARDGRLFTGVNVENAAYPLGICAERCRQWLAEWRFDRVTYRRANGDVVTVTPVDLLPDSFVL